MGNGFYYLKPVLNFYTLPLLCCGHNTNICTYIFVQFGDVTLGIGVSVTSLALSDQFSFPRYKCSFITLNVRCKLTLDVCESFV